MKYQGDQEVGLEKILGTTGIPDSFIRERWQQVEGIQITTREQGIATIYWLYGYQVGNRPRDSDGKKVEVASKKVEAGGYV